MVPYYTTTPATINCREEDRQKIEELLAVMPEELLSPETIKAIDSGEPIGVARHRSTAEFKKLQDPLVRACFDGVFLQTIEPKAVADAYQSADNREQWRDRLEGRCPTPNGPCPLRRSCAACPNRDRKQPFITSLHAMIESGADPSDFIVIKGNHRRLDGDRIKDTTAETAIGNVEREALIDRLAEAGEIFAKEYVLESMGYPRKEIAEKVGRSQPSVTLDFDKIKSLLRDFYKDWEA